MLNLPKDFNGIYIMTDKELKELRARVRREETLERLLQVSKEKNSATSIAKSTKRTIEKKEEPKKDTIRMSDVVDDMMSGKDPSILQEDWSEDFIWDRLLPSDYGSDDMVEEGANNNIYDYRFGPVVEEKDGYSDIFKSEIAMVSKVLKDVNEISKQAMRQLSAYNKKSAAGAMSKTYADTLTAVIQAQKARTDAIKMISDLKAKQADLVMKAKKDNPQNELTVDDTVAQFYASIMDGGRNEFVRNATMSFPENVPQQDYREQSDGFNDLHFEDPGSSDPGGQMTMGYDLTRPLSSEYDHYFDSSSDDTGYIRNEDRGVEVVVIRTANGSLSFAAIDENGEEVDDYELPGNDLLDTISIAPMSSTAYDKYSRRYRIIDYGDNAVDISDV